MLQLYKEQLIVHVGFAVGSCVTTAHVCSYLPDLWDRCGRKGLFRASCTATMDSSMSVLAKKLAIQSGHGVAAVLR